MSKLRTRADMQWGLEEGADVSSLYPRARFVDEYTKTACLSRSGVGLRPT
jgi:hypothetical protein